MPDNNPTLRATIARQVKGVFQFQFTSSFEIGGRLVKNGACLSELDESDILELAGKDVNRSQGCMVLAEDLVGVELVVGASVVLDGDPDWQIRSFKPSPDGACIVFTLMDAE